MSRRRRNGEVNCTCKAYDFPHRLMGGRCQGRRFVALFFRDNEWTECRRCPCYEYDDQDGGQCQVLNGQEDTWYCQGLQDVLHREEVPVPKKFRMKSWP